MFFNKKKENIMPVIKQEIKQDYIESPLSICYGAILGDYIGSKYEYDNIKTKDFELFQPECKYTDDSILTLAIKEGCENLKKYGYEVYEQAEQYFIDALQKWGNNFPNAKGGYGASFQAWLNSKNPQPYNSFGNGSAMRVSAVGWMFDTAEEVEKYAEWSAKPTHNHAEGVKGAKVTAMCIFLARNGHTKEQIREYAKQYYELKPCDEVRPLYRFDVTCQGTMPVALESFFESTDFEDAIRIAISMGGDSDTIGAITGSIAGAYYEIPDFMQKKAQQIVDEIMNDTPNSAI